MRIALGLAQILEGLGIPYSIVGSVASSIVGEPRSSEDVDFVVDLRPDQVAGLVAALEDQFHVQKSAAEDALRHGSSFNIFLRKPIFKVDLFTVGDAAFRREAILRGVSRHLVAESPGSAKIASPEYQVLAKLDWYEQAGRVSERQWRDVLGVLKNQAGRLDMDYLHDWARELGLSELLAAALGEAGVE